jgi:hypothetical protein
MPHPEVPKVEVVEGIKRLHGGPHRYGNKVRRIVRLLDRPRVHEKVKRHNHLSSMHRHIPNPMRPTDTA